jgi:hypothetical protein
MMVTMMAVMNSGVCRNSHACKNDQCNNTQKYIAHLHVKASPYLNRRSSAATHC